MPKKKSLTCDVCDGDDFSVVETVAKHWEGGKEVVEIITKYSCNDCGNEWETKSGS
jgi:hypothetical protein